MTVFVPSPPRRAVFAIAAALAATALQGCLSYDERGVLNADGTGEVSIVFGIPHDKVDRDKVAEVKRAAKRLRGLHWTRDIDSSRGGRRWIGAVIRFDSLGALRRLNSVLPNESMFETMKTTETDSGMVLRRVIKIPSGSAADGDFTRISWTFPGEVLQTDRRARRDSATGSVVWNLPVEGNEREWAVAQVRWEKPMLPVPTSIAGWRAALRRPVPPWSLVLGAAGLLGAILTAFVVAGHLKHAVRRFVANGRVRY